MSSESKTPATAPGRRGRPGGLTGAELLGVAREAFLKHGYPATTMDEIAAAARISKQTLYREFGSKDDLFAALVRDWVDQGRDAMRPHLDKLLATDDVESGLLDLATTLQHGVLSRPVVQMRSLVIAEAERLPEVAADYVRRSWERNQRMLAEVLAQLAEHGRLSIDTPAVAAQQFTWLVLAAPLDRITLTARSSRHTPAQLASIAREAVTTFLARYAPL